MLHRTGLVLLLLALTAPLSAQERLAIKGGRILPISGPPIEGGTVLIRGSVIEAVGKGISIPSDARVLDATGKVVTPGFVEAHSTRGTDQVNETNPNVPFLSVIDALDPSQDYFDECRRNGITTAAIVPGNATMFGGQAAVVRTAGTFVDEMIIKRAIGIKISLRPVGDRNRMGQLAAIRRALGEAKITLAGPTRPTGDAEPTRTGGGEEAVGDTQPRGRRPGGGGAPMGGDTSDATLVREALARLLRGDLMAYLYCEQAMDVLQAIRLVQEYKLKAILVLGQDCWKAARQVAAAKIPVILDPTLVFWETDARSGEERQVVLPRIYREAGVPILFQVTGVAAGTVFRAPSLPPTVGTNYLWYQAATAVKHGMSREDALAALTLRPAEALGLAKSHGSLEAGKEGDVVIHSGDPLTLDSWVETTVIGGKVVYERSQDRKLKALLKPEK